MSDSSLSSVRVRGARQNNLRDVDLDLPRDAIVAFTGVSGSGKSSLAFGTLYAESQRRYLESVAPYARRLIEQAGVPEVGSIEGMPPSVALKQQAGRGSSRSTVGSSTTVSSLVRMLYSRAGWYPEGQAMLYAEDFSANEVEGACPTCHGIGRVFEVTEEQMVPDPSLSIRERAIASWPPAWQGQNLRDILVAMHIDVDVPFCDLPRTDRDFILYTDEHPTVPVYAGISPAEVRRAQAAGREPSYQGTFTGARRYVLDTFAGTGSAQVKRRVAQFLSSEVCPACQGRRLKPEALSVTFEGLDIAELSALPLAQLALLLDGVLDEGWRPVAGASTGALDAVRREAARTQRMAGGGPSHDSAPDVRRTENMSAEKQVAARRLAGDLRARLEPMLDLGLGYLSLDRTVPTLSGGEMQRLRLATQLSSQLFGVVYVLDEPSAGLHPRDLDALLRILRGLRERGNTVFVVEHSLPVIREADWLVDIGPGAGEQGGQVLYSGDVAGLADVPESVTRRYLFPAEKLPAEEHGRDPRTPHGWLRLGGIVRNTLDGVEVALPVGCLTAVTGLSGSGKSSLVSQAVPAILEAALGGDGATGAPEEDGPAEDAELLLAGDRGTVLGHVEGSVEGIERVVTIDQRPIGRTPRSNVATYTGMFDRVRALFAATDEARRRRYRAGRFSFNVASGRCPTCEGEGSVMVELLFLPSVRSPCPECHGSRYQASTLEVTWRGMSIADVLALSVQEAIAAFEGEAEVLRSLRVLADVGLGYLRLGQPATELSGGEAQRVKLAAELQRARRGDTLYVLDEPTAGLHPADADRLLAHLQSLVDAGSTVVMAELDMRVVAQSDHVIDMGPGAGADGGRIVATGTPAEVVQAAESATAPYLRAALAG